VAGALPVRQPGPPAVTAAAVITALAPVAGAVLPALAALYWRRLPVLRTFPRRAIAVGASLTSLTRGLQSGVINDYVTWLVTGVAAIGGILALIVR
jgi:hypothetical protein